MSNLFSFRGTADRFDWWWISIIADVLAQVGLIFGFMLLATSEVLDQAKGVGLILLSLVCIWLTLAVTCRRLRARGSSLWMCALWFVPYIGWTWLVIECGILSSSGRQPKRKLVRRMVTAEQDLAD